MTLTKSDVSEAESFADTLRVVSGMVDIVVVRIPFALQRDVVSRSSSRHW